MNQEKFLKARNSLLTAQEKCSIYEDPLLNRTFNFVSANLINFMPNIPATEHEVVFKNIMLNKDLSILEQQYPEVLDTVSYEGLNKSIFTQLNNGPAIFCTFHMGSNRMVNHFLAANKIPFTLVIANHISKEEGDLFVQMFNNVYKSNLDNELRIIQAEQPNAALKMLRELKNGNSLLVYIDGNTGAGDDSIKNENRHKIVFLNQSIYARTGVAYLSYIANVPIIPVVCYRKSLEDLKLKFFPSIFPEKNMEKTIFTKVTTQKIFDLFVTILEKYPEQWECWIYLHQVANTKEFIHSKNAIDYSFRLNKKKFGVFNINSDLFLFDKSSYSSYPIDSKTYSAILKAANEPIHKNDLDDDLFQQLYDNHVLVLVS